jgi:hypothetical protein
MALPPEQRLHHNLPHAQPKTSTLIEFTALCSAGSISPKSTTPTSFAADSHHLLQFTQDGRIHAVRVGPTRCATPWLSCRALDRLPAGGTPVNDYLDRDDLLALDILSADADELLRQTSHTGGGGRPVVEADRLAELLGMIWREDSLR